MGKIVANPGVVNALNGKITSLTSASVAKANCSYTYAGVDFKKSGNVVCVAIHGLVSLPSGSSKICSVPTGFMPSSSMNTDIAIPSSNDGTGFRILRAGLNSSGELKIYNYGQTLSNSNAEIKLMFLLTTS